MRLEPSTAQPTASALLVACESAWDAIQTTHPEVPDVVLVLGTGVERGRLVKLGHWWDGRWMADGEVRGEVLLAGEALHLPPAQVFEVLLHEAAHGLNAIRGIKDTSRGGRYHNARFKATAEELGLVVAQMAPYGWAQTELGPDALVAYEGDIATIGEAMRIARRLGGNVRLSGAEETAGVGGEAGNGAAGLERGPTSGPARCGCGRRMRMAPSVLAQGPVLCGLCGQEFATERTAEQSVTPQPSQVEQAQAAAAPAPSEPSPAEQAIRTLTSLVATVDSAVLLAEVGAWREAHRSGEPRAIEVATVDELADANAAARTLLKLDGDLTGATVEVDGRDLLVGDLVMVGEHHAPLVDLDGVELPPPGVLGTVIRTDPDARSFVVDFPIAGTNRLDVHSPAATALEYGYAEVVGQLGAPLIDLRTLPESVPPDRSELSLVPELSWQGAVLPGEAAAEYAARGWLVLPCHHLVGGSCSCRAPDCSSPGKHPRISRGLHAASADVAPVERWWRRWPQANVGVRTGAESGLVVVDVDTVHGGGRSIRGLMDRYGDLRDVPRVRTGSGGWHLLFAHPGVRVPNSAGRLGTGIDVRGDGGYVIAPPSVHVSGRAYRWEVDAGDLPPLPEWLQDVMTASREPAVTSRSLSLAGELGDTSGWVRAAVDGEARAVRGAAQGVRNATLNRSAFSLGQIVGAGLLDAAEAERVLIDSALAVGLGEREAVLTTRSGLRAGLDHPRGPVERRLANRPVEVDFSVEIV